MPYALRLPNTGGYPMTPHRIFDSTPGSSKALIVNITPGELVPIDERGITLEEARAMDADPGNPLELVHTDKNGKEIHHKAGAAATDDTTEGKD